MTDARFNKIVNDRVEMILGLNDAIIKAGGVPEPWQEMKKQTVGELVNRLAQNGVRFTWSNQMAKKVNECCLETIRLATRDFQFKCRATTLGDWEYVCLDCGTKYTRTETETNLNSFVEGK